ncbi:MAG: hypothetical protein SGCHY_005636 [Lobulomycetales sp.]
MQKYYPLSVQEPSMNLIPTVAMTRKLTPKTVPVDTLLSWRPRNDEELHTVAAVEQKVTSKRLRSLSTERTVLSRKPKVTRTGGAFADGFGSNEDALDTLIEGNERILEMLRAVAE